METPPEPSGYVAYPRNTFSLGSLEEFNRLINLHGAINKAILIGVGLNVVGWQLMQGLSSEGRIGEAYGVIFLVVSFAVFFRVAARYARETGQSPVPYAIGIILLLFVPCGILISAMVLQSRIARRVRESYGLHVGFAGFRKKEIEEVRSRLNG